MNTPSNPASDLADLQTAYVTGDSGKDYARSVLAKYGTNPAAATGPITPFSGGVTPAIMVPTGNRALRYPYYSPFADNEELYAGAQTWYSKAGNGLLKGAGLTLSTFANGTLGLIAGTMSAISDGRFASFYDNDFSRALDAWNKDMENRFPNYYTHAEKDASWYSPSNLLTANFLFDKVLKNLGYSVGAIGAGMSYAGVLRSIGLFSKVAAAGGLARTAELTEQLIATVPQTQQASAVTGGIRQAAKEFLSRFNTLNTTQRIIASGLSTIGEANFEALQQLNDFRRSLIAGYAREKGRMPAGDELQEINRLSENAGNILFGLNTALLTATNFVQFPKILGSSYQAERNIYNSILQQAGEIVFDKKLGRYTAALPKTRTAKALHGAVNLAGILFSPSEALEELSQTAFQFGVTNYFNKAHAGQPTDILSDLLGEGYRQALTSKEGLESLLIGGFSGGIMELRRRIKDRGITGTGGMRAVNTQAAVSAFNEKLFTGFLKDTTDAVNRGALLQLQRTQAISRGDLLESKDLETDFTHNYLTPRIKYGRYDLVKDDIAQVRQLAGTDNGLQQLKDQGIISIEATRRQLMDRLDNFSRHADNVYLLYQSLYTRYAGIKDVDGNLRYPEEVIDKMVYASAKVADYDQRASTLSGALTGHGITVQPILDSLAHRDLPAATAVKDAVNQITNLDTLAETRETLRMALRDLTELALRRKHFLKEYDELKGYPQDFIEKKYGVPVSPSATGDSGITITQQNAQGQQVPFTVEPGKKYPLSDPYIREGNRLFALPAIEIHEQNLLGELNITAPDNEADFLYPEQLQQYNLLEPINEIEAQILQKAFEAEVDNLLKQDPFKDLVALPASAAFSTKMAAINAAGNKELADAIESRFAKQVSLFEKIQEKIRTVAGNEAASKALEASFQEQDVAAGSITTADPVMDRVTTQGLLNYDGAKKHIAILFKSSTSETTTLKGTGENDDFHRRANKFLNNLSRITDRENIQVAVVTRNNQQLLGLDGLIPEKVPGTDISATDVNDGIIRLVFIRTTRERDYFIDMDGNNLVPVGQPPSFTDLVYTTLPSTSLTWRNGETRYISSGANAADEKVAGGYQESWRNKRREFFASGARYETYRFAVSRGFPTYDENNTPSSVVDTLISRLELDSPVLVIPTHQSGQHEGRALGTIIHNEETVYMPLGRPVLKTDTLLLPLNNRKLTGREKQVIARLVALLARKATLEGKADKQILDYLRGLLFWKVPAAGKTISTGQIWFSGGYLHLGATSTRVPFIEELITASRELQDFLDNIYVSANNFLLTTKTATPFNEIIDIDEKGNPVQVQWKSYQHFLLDNIYTTTQDDTSGMQGTLRPADQILFTTDIVFPGPTTDKYAAVFEQKYITLHELNLSPGQPEVSTAVEAIEVQSPPVTAAEPAPEPASAPTLAPIIQAGDFILDGKHLNTIYYEDKALARVAATFTATGVQFGEYEHLGKKELTPTRKQLVLQLATVRINQAIVAEHEKRQQQTSALSPQKQVPRQEVADPAAPLPVETPSSKQDPSSPERPTVEDIFRNLSARRPPEDISGGQYRILTTTGRIVREDLRKLRDYQQKVLPQVPLHVLENLIRTTDGGYAWGVFRDNAIYLYRHAEMGSGYHEIFEAVYGLFLTARQQQQIIREFKGREGTFTDRESGVTLTYHSATDHQAREQIAEEFKTYVLEGTPPPGAKQKSFFARLLDFIKRLIFGRTPGLSDLFKSIDAGYYANKPVPWSNKTSGDVYSRFIPGLGTRFIHDTMQGITALVFDKLFSTNSNIVRFDEGQISFTTLYDEVLKRLETHFTKTLPEGLLADIEEAGLDDTESLKAKQLYADFLADSWIPIKNNWQALIEINKEFLKPFQIIFENDSTQDELEAAINAPDKNHREYERDMLRISARKNASTAVKLLFATLTEVHPFSAQQIATGTLHTTRRKLSSLKLPLLVNYAAAFNRLLYAVAGTNGLNNILSKIRTLAARDSTFVRLYNRLKVSAGYESLSLDDWKLLLKLYSVTSRQKPEYQLQITDESGRTYITSASDNLQTRQVVSGWLNDLKAHAGPGRLVYIDQQRYRIRPAVLAGFDVKSLEGKLSFLQDIGISFTREQYDSLTKTYKTRFNDGAQRLFNELSKSADIATISGRALGISGPLAKLAEAYVAANGETTEPQHFNIEGEPVQNLVLNNYVSLILNDISYYQTRDELLEVLPHLQDVFSKDSLMLEKGGLLYDDNGNRREESLGISIFEGSKTVGNRPGVPTSRLSLPARRMQEFNQNLQGIFNILIPADSTTEWCLNLNNYHYIPFSDFANPGALSNKVYRIFKNYLRTEIELANRYVERSDIGALELQGRSLRFFKNILSASLVAGADQVIQQNLDADAWLKTNESRLRASINEWLGRLVEDQLSFFKDYQLVTADSSGNYTFHGLNSDFAETHKLEQALSEADLKDIIRFRTLNYVIQQIEFHKVFFGDPALYPDATKRIKSFLSGRETTYHSDVDFDRMAHLKLNSVPTDADQPIPLSRDDPGYQLFRDYMPTVTVADVKVVGSLALQQDIAPALREAYEQVDEADAQSWMRLAAYRQLLHKAGGRWTEQIEAQYQYEHAYERIMREKKGSYVYTNLALKRVDLEVFARGNPEAATFHVIKPVGTGVKYGATFMDMFLDKTSTVPLFYRLVEGNPMEELYIQMQRQDVDYVIAASGRKIGAEKLHSLYNPDGSVNEAAFNNRINIPFKYYGIQVETGTHAPGQTRGTQLTKLATLDLMNNGVPIDVSLPYAQWSLLPEAEKKALSPIYTLVAKNKAILQALTEAGYRKALSTLQIEETDGRYRITDKNKIAAFLKKELQRRELPQNLIDAISIDPDTDEFTVPLEALPNYKALKNIIYSVVDRSVLSPLMPGGPKVQVSSTLFERNRRQAIYKPEGDSLKAWQQVTDYDKLTEKEKATVRLTASDLKFYTRDAPYMEVYLPHWFKEKLKTAAERLSDKQLLDYLNKKDSPLLHGIGFRIPTQSSGAIEHFRVKGFLPQEMGDTIIVPSEITVKAGSDFDIDKLNTYLKHFYIDNQGRPTAITLEHIDTGSEQALGRLYEDWRLYRGVLQNEQAIKTDQQAARLLSAIFETEVSATTPIKESLEDFIVKNKGRDIYDLYSEYDIKALENEYIATLEQLLSLPQNFDRLIQPNSADQLKALRNELNQALDKASSETKGNFALLLNPMFMSQVRHNFLAGKGGVGIAALQQTGTALSQLSAIILDPNDYASRLSPLELSIVQDLQIRLPHNQVEIEGNTYATLSSVTDHAGHYISDKVSAYINGYVDVAKDPFIIELGASLNVASTFMFLERVGVPMRDVIFFMNQPIIRDFIKAMEIGGLTTPVSGATEKLIGQIKSLYPASRAATGVIDTAALKDDIIKRVKGVKFTAEENAAQQMILDEFLKYTIFADHLFQLNQGYNYDTANFSEAAMIFRKQQLTQRARTGNLFSSVDKILDNSFIGRVAERLSDIKDALGSIFKLDSPVVAPLLEQILSTYIQRRVSEDDYLAIAARLQASFLDYLTQVYSSEWLNMQIAPLLLGNNTAAASLTAFKDRLTTSSDLAANPVLRYLQPLYDSSSSAEPHNIGLTEKAYDAYTFNLYTEAMRELRDNIHTSELYRRLVRLSLIQSGTRNSPISFTGIIPVEDYAPFLAEAVRRLDSLQGLQHFADNYAFQRVYWWDERIVPTVEPKEVGNQLGSWFPLYSVPPRLFRNLGITNRQIFDFIQLNSHFQARELQYPVVKVRQIGINPSTKAPYTAEEQAEMRKKGDYSFRSYKLYQKVLTGESQPLSYPAADPKRPWAVNVIYKQINAWGKPGLVQEYYETVRPSVLPSNIKISEFSDAEVVEAFNNTGANTPNSYLQISGPSTSAELPSRAGSQTLEKVYNFLRKAGVEVKKVREISVNGKRLDANAIADITAKLIEVVDGKQDTTLPEEAMHFAVEIVSQTHPRLYQQMLREIGRYRIYERVLATYRSSPLYMVDGRPDIIKIKKEAIARVLVETLINRQEGSTEKPELLARVATWWENILDFLKRLFTRAGFNPFEHTVTLLSDNALEGPLQDQSATPPGIYLQKSAPSHQQALADKLINIHRQLAKEHDPQNPSESYYLLNGKKVPNRVTNLSKKYYNEKFRHKQISETELQKALNDQKREKGVEGHSDLEDIFHRLVDDDGFLRDEELVQTQPSKLDATDNSYYKTLESNLRQRMRSFNTGTRFFSELMIYDPAKDQAGTIDFLAIEPDASDGTPGKVHILDWKFIDLRTDATDVPWYKKEAWNIQLSEYVRMLGTPVYGVAKQTIGRSRAIPIRARYIFEQQGNKLKLYSIHIGDVDVKAIQDDTLLPVPVRGESTGNRELDELIGALNNLSEKIYETRSDPGKEYLKTERLNELVTAIRHLHLKQEAEKLFDFAKRDIRELNDVLKGYFEMVEKGELPATGALNINDLSRRILDAEDLLSLYGDLGRTFRRIFDENADKSLLREAERISYNAEILRGKLLQLAGALRTNPIARGAGITDMLNPEKVISWYQKWVRSLSQGATKATQILWNIVSMINSKVQLEFSDEIRALKELEKNVTAWISATGKDFKAVEDMLFAKDSKGRWNGKVISRVDPSFYNALSVARLKKDAAWVLDNINVEEYMQWYKKELQARKDNYLTSRLHENDEQDKEIKKKRLQEFEMFYDIQHYPDSAITMANLKLNAYPHPDKWKSAAYKTLLQPGNEAILQLYNHWERKLEASYQLGMIKAWERKSFFPNVRKDFLDKLVFGSGDKKLRRANLGFLDAVRLDVDDEVFGYTDLNGNPQDKLSALYVYDLGEKVTAEDGEEFTDYSNKSTDLFKVMALWTKEMIKFKHKSEVVDTVRLLYLTERNRKAIARSPKTGGLSVRSDGSPVLVDNVENSEYFKNFMDYYFYGKRLSQAQDVTFNFRYNKLATKVNKFFGSQLLPMAAEEEITISGKKMIAATNRFFQMKTLGLNLATAVTNYVGGKANAYMLAGRFFTKADYTRASFKMSAATFHTQEGRIYAGLLNYFLPLTDDRTRQQIRDLSVSRAVKLLSSDHLFYLMRTSDQWIQYPAAIAFFDNTMVEDGKLVNIREYVKQKNGYGEIYRLPAAEQKALREKIEQEITILKESRSLPRITTIENDRPVIAGVTRDSRTVYDLRNRIQQFSKDALGNMSEEDISQYRLTLLGQSFMMFKNWIPRMADVRFGEFRYQAGTDAYEWGRVSMLFNALRHSFLSGAAAALGTLVGANGSLIQIARKMYQVKKAQVEATGEQFLMTEAEFIDHYIKGIRTQLKELLLLASMISLLLYARAQAPDDDDRTSGAYRWLVRTIDKMTDELGFFYNPLSFTAIANGSVFPSVQILTDLVKLIRSLSLESFYLVIGDQQSAEKNKVVKYLFKTFPITKEILMYVAIFNEDLAKEYGITISTSARRNW